MTVLGAAAMAAPTLKRALTPFSLLHKRTQAKPKRSSSCFLLSSKIPRLGYLQLRRYVSSICI